MIKLRATGRGAHFSVKRGLLESAARVVYWRGWPGRLGSHIRQVTDVNVIHRRLDLGLLAGAGGGRRPLRLAFASDLHIGPLTPPKLLDHAFAELARARPDLLVLGGDYVFLEATEAVARELEARVAAVPATVKVAVLGNHDLWTRHERLEAALQRAGARVLINDAVRLPPPFDHVAIIGLDEPWSGKPDPVRALRAADGAAVTLAVAHSPEAVPLLAKTPVSLLLCGHTHGGQIATPTGPVLVHGRHGRVWPAGLFDLGDMKLFVSRGLGMVELPLRFYAQSDVAVFDLA